MTFIRRHARAIISGLALGAAVLLAVELFPSRLLDLFYERQIEAKAIAVWKRQAVDVDYSDCREGPTRCLGKVVAWPVTRLSDSTACWGSRRSEPIRWRNAQQVPYNGGPSNSFEAVARVVGIDPDAVVLLYIGTTDPQFGGTTWGDKFGRRDSSTLLGRR
jgi:hypothetical protein